MAYAITPVQGSYSLPYAQGGGFPSTFRYFLISAWAEIKSDGSGWQMQAIGYDPSQGISGAFRGFTANLNAPGPGSVLTIGLGNDVATQGGTNPYFGQATFDASGLSAGVYYNILISVDSIAEVIQCYVNDVALPPSGAPVFQMSSAMSEPFAGSSGSPRDGEIDIFHQNNTGMDPCVADAYWTVPGSFFDLSVTANRRQFINADLTPVYLGTNGQNPLGTTPLVYASIPTGGIASEFATNLGSIGGTFTASGLQTLCTPTPPPTPNPPTMADLWFGTTLGFVDLTTVSNRRNFVSVVGGAQNLGPDGSEPFGVTPQVFLTNTGVPTSFTLNNGRGGEFPLQGGSIVAGASNPPGSTETQTTYKAASTGQGVLGDYRNGNLYAFNTATLLDNGTQRKWVRRWRALDALTMSAVAFRFLTIGMETGVGVPSGTNPQIMLRWSDDGGYTWSDYRILAVGPLGATTFKIKFNRLGMTRRFNGSDRVFELSSTDPFDVAILDAELDSK